jgi:hypothetical protein
MIFYGHKWSVHTENQFRTNRDYLKMYHQNIRSIRRKTYELLSHLYPDLPHVLCLTEHHLNTTEMNYAYIENYNVGAQFCRTIYERGRAVVIFVNNSLQFRNIDLSKIVK